MAARYGPRREMPVALSWQRVRQWLLLGLFVGVSLLLLFALTEGILRLVRPDRFYPYHRNSRQLFYPSEQATPGVTGISRFTTNSLGTRGPELDGERVRILTIGGSTTACTVLDDDETWPALLMEYLGRDAGDPSRVWVTNSGVDGQNSHHHIMHAKYLLPRLPAIDYVILYAGLNDVGMWLYSTDFDPHALDDPAYWDHRIGEAFRVSNFTPAAYPWYKHLELWKRASIAKDLLRSRFQKEPPSEGAFVQDAELEWMEEARQQRHERAKEFVHRAKMDTLPAALDSYGANLERIAQLVRTAEAEPIFVAQAIQHQFLDESERRRLWMGAMDGGKTYVKEEQMLELLRAYNQRMREVAERQGVLFIDLPGLLHGHKDLFYDGVHLNEAGARAMARVLADRIGPLLEPAPAMEGAEPSNRSGASGAP